MDTMMGVKKSLDPAVEAELGLIKSSAPRYSLWHKLKLICSIIHKSEIAIVIIVNLYYSVPPIYMYRHHWEQHRCPGSFNI